MVPLSVSTSSIHRLFSFVDESDEFGRVGSHTGETSPDDFHSMEPDVSTSKRTFGCCATTSGPSVWAWTVDAASTMPHRAALILTVRRFLILPACWAAR